MTAPTRPTLLNSCASAATAEEARFRIDRPIGSRAALIVALDEDAAEIVDRVAELPWGNAKFFRSPDEAGLFDQIAEADVAIMVGTSEAEGEAAAAVAKACAGNGIMTAGLILGERLDVTEAVSALRPYARNLMVTEDEDDVAAVLTALRA